MRRRDLLRTVGTGSLAGFATASAAGQETTTTGVPDGGEDDVGASFAPLASLPIDDAREAVVGADGKTVYVATTGGFAVVDAADPAEPRFLVDRRGLLADFADGPLRGIQQVAVDGDRLLVMGPAHPDPDAIHAAVLFDVSDPTEPRRLAVHGTDYPIHNGVLDDGLAYLTANDRETEPLVIVAMAGQEDGTGEPETRVLGRWSLVDEDVAWGSVPAAIRPIHDVIVHDGVAYCSYWDAGTWLVDVREPAAPRAIGHVGERSAEELSAVEAVGVESTELPGNHHSASIDETGTLLAVGHEGWDADEDGVGGPGGITLVDVSSPDTPRRLGYVEPPTTTDPTRRGVWTTAHNFELRGGRLYSAWYQGGIRVHDVSDPTDPREVAAWRDSSTTRFWTAQLADDAIVASSMGTDDGQAGLYTFPIPGRSSTAATRSTEPRTETTRTTTTESTASTQVVATPGATEAGALVAVVGGGLAWLLTRGRRD